VLQKHYVLINKWSTWISQKDTAAIVAKCALA